MDLPDFLIDHPDGEIRLAGHRLGLYDVISLYQQGYSAEKIGDEYPTLPVAVIHQLIAFYRKNQGEVDAYVAAYREELDRQEQAYAANPGALHLKRLQKMLQEAERKHAGDPAWSKLSIREKMERLALLNPSGE